LADHDAVIVGSGVNGLACAALLAKGGWDVCVLERNDWFGGASTTSTAPGIRCGSAARRTRNSATIWRATASST
jgi:phytoene dehydrogenase-like protein